MKVQRTDRHGQTATAMMRIPSLVSIGLLVLSCHAAIAETHGSKETPASRKLLFEAGQTIAFDGDSLTFRGTDTRHSWSYLRLNRWQETWADVVEDWFFCN